MAVGFFRSLATCALLAASPCAATEFDASPWLADLEQARQAFHDKYANWDWAETERGVKIDALFDDSAARLRKASNEAAAHAVFDHISRKIGDGHVEIDWPEPPGGPGSAAAAPAPDLCKNIGYDPRQNAKGTAQALPGYSALPMGDNPFEAGMVQSGGAKVGVIRIGIFQPQGYPELCRAAVRDLSIPADKSCDDACQNKIVTWAYQRLTPRLEDRIRELKAAGATVMLVDITTNGGGSEWAEAAARIFTPKLLVSEQRGFVRGDHWAKQWRDLAARLREFAKSATSADRRLLLQYAAVADAALRQAGTPCPATSASCERLGRAGYSTGPVGAARSGTFDGKEDWAVHLFSPAQFPYHDGVWNGPLIVLVDQETWSAAEEFAAVLQDNKAAVIMGARTGGAGCGYTWGGTPTTLKNSGAVLKLPDCVRFRADGSNEVRGILPDELVAYRFDDGAEFKAKLVAEKLPAAIARARALAQ